MTGDRIDDEHFDVTVIRFRETQTVKVRAGRKRTKRIVPPAGEEWAFDMVEWPHEVEVYVSKTGRSVRLWIDGKEMQWPGK